MLRPFCFLILALGSAFLPAKELALESKKRAVDRLVDDLAVLLNETLSYRYQRAKSPSFVLVKGFYRLPAHKPTGAARIIAGYSYQSRIKAVRHEEGVKDYRVDALSSADARSFGEAIALLEKVGVSLNCIDPRRALPLAVLEEKAKSAEELFLAVPPLEGDHLLSIDRLVLKEGPGLIGRVVKKDGSLKAFRVVLGTNGQVLASLIMSLFEDTLSRI